MEFSKIKEMHSLINTEDCLLKQNSDFVNLVQVIRELQQQQKKAQKDIEELKKTKQEAINNPLVFIEQLKHKERKLPSPQDIPQIPKINLEIYSSFEEESDSESEWTEEEINELQTLFIQNSSKNLFTRCEKIAKELGKSQKQVEYQAQKLKLIPNLKKRKRNENNNLKSKRRKFNSPSTKQQNNFKYSSDSEESDYDSNDDSYVLDFEEFTIGQEFFSESLDMPFTTHYGSKCNGCGMEPIRGPRWQCNDCCKIDLCETCYHSGWENDIHKRNHRLDKADVPIHLNSNQYIQMDPLSPEYFVESPLTPETNSPFYDSLSSPLFGEFEQEFITGTSLLDNIDPLPSSSFA